MALVYNFFYHKAVPTPGCVFEQSVCYHALRGLLYLFVFLLQEFLHLQQLQQVGLDFVKPFKLRQFVIDAALRA